ncbi:D-3-phosphoglycerate dehydrogenase [Weissella uvarum]|uniref:NAD(P)-dependent oxidoreductase n=1 Tax=Weissella uvarum TaxID=1479233 RepID=UPI00196088B0|nr:NAD(P)-dependent oxidoreductase [Weissella uvarum]MBM7617635.1 D-3-phosphoglycerate dehydrogenase [Weissella uvarum]MCM0595984.1 dihydrofolate reductase [Weissella uvarum]
MAKPKILVTGVPHMLQMEALADKFDFTYAVKKPYTREELLEAIPDQDGVVFFGFQADREFIDAAKNLKIIATASVGFDHVDIDYAQEKGIVVANTPEAVRVSTAETALALMLNVMRRIPSLNHKMHEGEWTPMADPRNQGASVQGKTLGIYGMGRIGKTFAKFAQMLGMEVIYHNRHQLDPKDEADLNVKYVSFDDLIQQADVLSLHAPATKETQHVINAQVFDAMKPTAFLINVARGVLVDQKALADALKQKQIAGAGLDVFENEPQVPDELTRFDNVVMTPHAGTGTIETQDAIFAEAMDNIDALLYDGKPTNMVNHVAKYEDK